MKHIIISILKVIGIGILAIIVLPIDIFYIISDLINMFFNKNFTTKNLTNEPRK